MEISKGVVGYPYYRGQEIKEILYYKGFLEFMT